MRTDELDYTLPPDLIATKPAHPRDAARLMVVSRSDPARLEHRHFRDLPDLLRPTDLLIRNRSAVVPARLSARRQDTGGKVEGLFIRQLEPARWLAMLRSNGRLRPGLTIQLSENPPVAAELIERTEDAWTLAISDPSTTEPHPAAALLAKIGATPLPPYILGARKDQGIDIEDTDDRVWYQTVYADPDHAGSVAAPTAGLHFTQSVIQSPARQGHRRSRSPPPRRPRNLQTRRNPERRRAPRPRRVHHHPTPNRHRRTSPPRPHHLTRARKPECGGRHG